MSWHRSIRLFKNCRMDPAPVPHGEAPSFDTMMTQTAPAPDRPSTRDDVQFATVEETGDRRLAYAEYGAENGSPMVFLHGRRVRAGSRSCSSRRRGTLMSVYSHRTVPDTVDPTPGPTDRYGTAGESSAPYSTTPGSTLRVSSRSRAAPRTRSRPRRRCRVGSIDWTWSPARPRRSTLASVPRHSEC